jgi:NADPH-dependent glutamate synthase beta subunit-like oxidoreductase
MEEVPGSEKFFPAQLVFLALGFLGPQPEMITSLGVKQDVRSNVQTPPKVCGPVIATRKTTHPAPAILHEC